MKIIVAGPGCARCQAAEKNVFNACAELNLDADITPVHEVRSIAALGVMATPAVLVDGTIVASGKVHSVEELKALFASIHS
jgi:small redox-active disulfide protein 2